jgi:glycosyltransferase involved in cell wall biosynthesis
MMKKINSAKIILPSRLYANDAIVRDDGSEDRTEETRRLGVVIGPPARAKSPELILFGGLHHFYTEFISSIAVSKLLPEFLTRFPLNEPYGPQGFFRLRNLEKRLKNVDVISCIELYPFISQQCAHLAKKEKKKLVVSVFETVTSIPFTYSPPYSWNVKSVLKHADAFIAYTKRARDYLRRLCAPNGKIKVVYPGVDLQAFSPLNRRDHENFRILFVGRLSHSKGISLLLKAFSRLYAGNKNVELWMCGAGQRGGQEEVLARAMAKRHPIRILGYVEHGSLPDVQRECDVLCLPSIDMRKCGIKVWEEQFGFVLVEAMACGLPIVATNCGAIPEVIGSRNIIVPQESSDALYLALRGIMEDDAMRQDISRANRARAESLFDIKKQREKFEKILAGCFDERA